jgi:hypothetical protein
MTTPADELRAASALVRAAAEPATPGPRTVVPRYRKGTNVLVQYDIYKPPLPGSNIPQHRTCRPGDVDELYAAAIHPGVGLALATWLDSAAHDAEQIGADPHALTVARQILGTTVTDEATPAPTRPEAAAIHQAADWLRTEYPGPGRDRHIRLAADALNRYAETRS